jgi:hypothetical protein
MSNELVSLREARERTIARLSDLFASDELDVDEFDRRLTVAHRAGSLAEIEALVADFPTVAATTAVARAAPAVQVVPAASTRARQSIVAIFGGAVRRGQWTAPRNLRIVTVCGGAQIDFREARLPTGVTTVSIFAVMGGVEIIVPPGLSVEVDGAAVMGGFDHLERSPPSPDPDRPTLRIQGFAMMGGVHVATRLPGEDERDARRRQRRERRALRAAARDGQRALPSADRH